LLITFHNFFLKFSYQSFFVIQWMYFLCTTILLTSQKTTLIFSQAG